MRMKNDATNLEDDVCFAVRGLTVEFGTMDGTVRAVNGVDFSVGRNQVLGVVGESGSGKSVSVMSSIGLISHPGRVTGGSVHFGGQDLLTLSQRQMRSVRGRRIGLVSQDPMTSFNPVVSVGDQLTEAITIHDRKVTRKEAVKRAIGLLELVGVPNPARRVKEYPHQYSGGMRQRAMIAMAIANEPELLIADEPTTALDVTIQAQVLRVLKDAMARTSSSMILITHDLGVIAEMADQVVVMYAGRVVEYGDVRTIFRSPRHPYTIGLMSSLPRVDLEGQKLTPIAGSPPSALHLPKGCAFERRCGLGRDQEHCRTELPQLESVGAGHGAACHLQHEVQAWAALTHEERTGRTIDG
jgi:oligopeptide/dipeptide ABC transporter ATP-binding protein